MADKEYSRMEINELKTRISILEKHTSKITELEKSLIFHETLLTRKLTELNALEQKMKGFVHQEHLKHIMKSLGKMESHDGVIFESATQIRKITSELDKIKKEINGSSEKHDLNLKVKHLEAKMGDRLNQIEYQNKLIMKYLKKIDEKLF